MALYAIADGQASASEWARRTGREDETVIGWVRRYNELGPDALTYRRTGGRARLFRPEQSDRVAETVRTSEPADNGLTGHGWTLKKLREWAAQTFGIRASRATLHGLLRRAKVGWKKFKKFLGKANADKRAAHMPKLDALFKRCCRGEIVLIWADESHFHRDMDSGYTWDAVGKRAWRKSDCPRLSERINWYGAYDFGAGRCLIWNEGNCNGEHTCKFLERVAEWQKDAGKPVVIIWDGAPWHRAKCVAAKGAELNITLELLPGYSPDLNPIERLWSWMREEVTAGYCHATMRELFDNCKAFIDRINTDAMALVDRLWPKFELDPDHEAKFRVSN